MVDLKNNRIEINGKPVLIMSGEIHYFRLPKESWQDRINKLKRSGCNTVASYVPWICHELNEGEIDLDGRTKAQLDLWGFIDLCKENGLYFIIRPGPLIMAEMKNEGLPQWLYEKYPQIIPMGWDGVNTSSRNVDLLSPFFTKVVKRWYKEIMKGVKERLEPNGGNIIALQPDNEIGMLSWVANSPDLTDSGIKMLCDFLKERYEAKELNKRYPGINKMGDDELRKLFLSPKNKNIIAAWNDISDFLRKYYEDYFGLLRKIAIEEGITGIPFIVNIHGTAGGRGLSFPIGISQLKRCMQHAGDVLSGSDIYFGNLSRNNFHDLYLSNIIMKACAFDNSPIGSVEFEAGDGDYGQYLSGNDGSATDLKLRMCIAQSNRFINFYLFSGGYNYRFENSLNDGDDRIAFTGERHGVAAPINPEGLPNRTFERMSESIRSLTGYEDFIAVSKPVYDNIMYGFVPDYYKTECRYRESSKSDDFVESLERGRAYGFWDSAIKSILLGGYTFGAVDLSKNWPDPLEDTVLIVPIARYMPQKLQYELIEFLSKGGKALLFGEIPKYDFDGNLCDIVAKGLELREINFEREESGKYITIQNAGYFTDYADHHSWWVQTYKLPKTAVAVLSKYPTGECCGFYSCIGKGKVIAITCQTPANIEIFSGLLNKMGIFPGFSNDDFDRGTISIVTETYNLSRLIHIINLDDKNKTIHLAEKDKKLFDGEDIKISEKSGLLLPLDLKIYEGENYFCGKNPNDNPKYVIEYSTAEVCDISSAGFKAICRCGKEKISIKTNCRLVLSEELTSEKVQGGYKIVLPASAWGKRDKYKIDVI